jgi:NAD(P)H-nitrite reductase large subunit
MRSPNAGLTSLAEIGSVLRASTNCGSCLPELKKILRDHEIGGIVAG